MTAKSTIEYFLILPFDPDNALYAIVLFAQISV